MGAVAVPLVTKMVVGFAVGKLVSGITGNELLGMVAGGLAGGGLGFSNGGFSWSMDNIVGGMGTSGEAGVNLVKTMPGGTDLLSGSDIANSSLLGTSGNVDLFGGANLVDTASVVGNLGVDPSTTANAVADLSSSGVSDKFTFDTNPSAEIANAEPGASNFDLFSNNSASEAATTPGNAGGSFLDKSMDFINQNPGVTNILANGVSSMLEPDPGEVAEEELAAMDRYHRIPGQIRTPNVSMVDKFE